MRPQAGGGATPHYTEEGGERQVDAPGQLGDHALAVQRDMKEPLVGELLGQGTRQGADEVPTPVLAQPDVQDAHLENVPGHGAADGHRARHDVTDGFRGHVLVHLEVFGEYLEPAVGQDLGRSGKAVKRDGITRLDLEDRRQRRVEDSPVNRPGTGMELVMSSHPQSFPAEARIGRPPVQAD